MCGQKGRISERAVLHPAVLSRKWITQFLAAETSMAKIVNQYDAPGNRRDAEEYAFRIIGDPDANAQHTHLDNVAKYLVACQQWNYPLEQRL
ncbi:hypothetical protein DL768_007436 [Monosporascus sp. mg162]|nr:hypothetical protein DL768_007436 [Monosporascus sp. mg162]